MHPAAATERPSEVRPARRSAWSTFWQTLVGYQSEKVNAWLAVRNTIGVALLLAIGVELSRISSSLVMSTGALNVAFSDSQEPYAQRARHMCAASVLGGFAVFSGSLSGRNPIAAVLAATAGAFVAGILVALSTAAADLGAVSLVTPLVYESFPLPADEAVTLLTRENLPDLREDHHALVHSGDSLAERYALVKVETDRITNSLNTLSEELLRWMESGKQPGE
jgi:hypothetical protein